jgi:cyclohexadieny/prephenate dehydrogenase
LRAAFERLAVVGLGLLGGSVALGARKHGIAAEIRAVDPREREPQGIPLVSLREAAGWADLVVLAVPVEAMEPVLRELAPALSSAALLTDVASVKGPMAELARRCLPHPERCVGAHPMAGGHQSGFGAARADLFEGAPCFITPAGTEDPAVVDRIEGFWQGLGAVTARRTPEEHDAICALLSHVPHVIAYAFSRGLPGSDVLELAGPGLRDFIRIARGNSKLWCEILLMNRERVAEEVARFQSSLEEVLGALERGDRAELERVLEEGRRRSERLS